MRVRHATGLAAQSCLTRCEPLGCSPPGSLSMGFPRQEYWSGFSFPPPGDLLDPGIQTMFPAHVFCIAGRFFTTELPGKPAQRVLEGTW